MTLPLDTEVTIRLGANFIHLRPAVRHGMRLEAREGGFAKLIVELQEGSLSAALFILEPFSPFLIQGQLGHAILDEGVETVSVQLIAFVLRCGGIDERAKAPEPGNQDQVPFKDYLSQLYRYGTGWLGWTPEVTLNATPWEISEAYQGRIELLKAVFGSPEETRDAPVDLTAKFKMAFADLGSSPEHPIKTVKRQRRAA